MVFLGAVEHFVDVVDPPPRSVVAGLLKVYDLIGYHSRELTMLM